MARLLFAIHAVHHHLAFSLLPPDLLRETNSRRDEDRSVAEFRLLLFFSSVPFRRPEMCSCVATSFATEDKGSREQGKTGRRRRVSSPPRVHLLSEPVGSVPRTSSPLSPPDLRHTARLAPSWASFLHIHSRASEPDLSVYRSRPESAGGRFSSFRSVTCDFAGRGRAECAAGPAHPQYTRRPSSLVALTSHPRSHPCLSFLVPVSFRGYTPSVR